MFTGSISESSASKAAREGAQEYFQLYTASTEEFSAVAGIVNAGYGRLVDLTLLAIAEGHDVGPGLYSPSQYVAWQSGVSRATANRICRLARRHMELPETLALLRSGKISLDQADVIAQSCPSEYERDASQVALYASVAQLRLIVGCYSHKGDEETAPAKGVTVSRDKNGATVRARLDHSEADLFEQALQAMRDDLFRQHKEDLASGLSSGSASGSKGEAKPVPSRVDALVALSEAALRAGQAEMPISERYLVNYHLHLGPDGHLVLTNQNGQQLPEWERQLLLCDHAIEAMFHGRDGTPLSVGRKSRLVNPKLRRAILFRDHNRCAVPGCDTTVGLEIHHIVHWEHGGGTDTSNLLALCGHHHKIHHQGLLNIEGNADASPGQADALSFTHISGIQLYDINPPKPLTRVHSSPSLARLRRELKLRTRRPSGGLGSSPMASTPCGEKLDRSGIHLNATKAPTPMRT